MESCIETEEKRSVRFDKLQLPKAELQNTPGPFLTTCGYAWLRVFTNLIGDHGICQLTKARQRDLVTSLYEYTSSGHRE